jgi:hypothetical protein
MRVRFRRLSDEVDGHIYKAGDEKEEEGGNVGLQYQ